MHLQELRGHHAGRVLFYPIDSKRKRETRRPGFFIPVCIASGILGQAGLGREGLKCSHIHATGLREVRKVKFVGVREFKQDAIRYLNEGNEIVVMKRTKPIARLIPIQENTPEALLLDIGRVLNEAGVTKEETLRALERARREIYG